MAQWLEYVHAKERDTQDALEHLCDVVMDTVIMGSVLDMRCIDPLRVNRQCLALVLRLTKNYQANVLHRELAVRILG